MHLYIVTRGIKYAEEQAIHSLLSNMLPYNLPKTGQTNWVQLAVRPINFYELVFPKEMLPNVLKGIKYDQRDSKTMAMQRTILRKALGAKKIPKLDLSETKPIFCQTDFVGINAIGIKEDKIWGHDPSCPEMEGAEML